MLSLLRYFPFPHGHFKIQIHTIFYNIKSSVCMACLWLKSSSNQNVFHFSCILFISCEILKQVWLSLDAAIVAFLPDSLTRSAWSGNYHLHCQHTPLNTYILLVFYQKKIRYLETMWKGRYRSMDNMKNRKRKRKFLLKIWRDLQTKGRHKHRSLIETLWRSQMSFSIRRE